MLDTIKPELRKKTTGPGVFPLRSLLSSLFMGPISPCGSPHTGKRKLAVSLFDHIVDDDDQDVLAVTRLGNAQLAGLSNFMLHVVNDSGLSLEQSAIHNASLRFAFFVAFSVLTRATRICLPTFAFSAPSPVVNTPRAFWTALAASVLPSMCS